MEKNTRKIWKIEKLRETNVENLGKKLSDQNNLIKYLVAVIDNVYFDTLYRRAIRRSTQRAIDEGGARPPRANNRWPNAQANEQSAAERTSERLSASDSAIDDDY